MILFPDWELSHWRKTDDSLRGGKSWSQIKPVRRNNLHDVVTRPGGVTFSGVVDTKALGGAGFASQRFAYSPPLNLNSRSFSGLRLHINEDDLTELATSMRFTITITTTPEVLRPDGRRESRINWEVQFKPPQVCRHRRLPWLNHNTVVIDVPFETFLPFFRGRPVADDLVLEKRDNHYGRRFDTDTIHEIGIMCRSDFGKQEGPFSLTITKIEATERRKELSMPGNGRRTIFCSLL